MNEQSNESPSEVNISLSPESGSLFHSYHSKSTSMRSSNSPKDKEFNAKKVSRFNRNRSSKKLECHYPPYSSQRMEKFPLLESTDYFLADEEATKHCTKTFHLKDSSNASHALWQLPSSDGFYTNKQWKVDELWKLKDELNEVKTLLESYDIEEWHKHTHLCNPAQKVSYSVKCKAKPDLLTQAFLKFYEIVHGFPIVPEEGELGDTVLRSLHLCEAPGAFIVALNHFLALQRPNMKWQWLGNTLNPYFEGTPSSECVSDDRFILFTLDSWHFGEDETGNLMSPDYLRELIERLQGHKVHLVTADGSIDCQGNPSEQEAMTHGLHFCEVYSALCVLNPGGALVLKKFTFFEAESINILYLISNCFDDVYVHKPITSKLGNSEVYVVAVGYNPPSCIGQYLETLRQFYGKSMSTTLFSEQQIPASFLSQIKGCCTFFKTHQVNAIKRNIDLYKDKSERSSQYCDLLKSVVLRKYLENNYCLPIHLTRKITPQKLEWDRYIIPESNIPKWGGQIMKKAKPLRLKFLDDQHHLLTKFYSVQSVGEASSKYQKREYSQDSSVLNSLCAKKGKPFHFVFVSRFSSVNLMQIYVHYFMETVTDDEMEQVQSSHNSDLSISNSTSLKARVARVTEEAKTYALREDPNTLILDEGHFPAPHGCHKAFDDLLVRLRDGRIEEGTSVAILNSPLLTRLQNSLLALVSSLFKKVVFYEPLSVLDYNPFFVLRGFTSISEGKRLVASLKKEGWEQNTSSGNINQLLPLQIMIQSPLHPAVCRYNALYCLHNIQSLKTV